MKPSLSKRCKTRSTLLALGLSLSFSALAQTDANVTLYGIVDQSLRFTNHRSDSGGTHLEVANGAITGSRWGLRGQEDLGNGLKALFNLESGFEPQTGSLNQGGRLFGRYAWVGLADDNAGTFMLGRNGAESFNFFGEFDPLTVGNYMANSWPFLMTVGRLDNMANYAGQFGGLKVGAGYGFNNTFANNAFAYRGVRLSYHTDALAFGATVQELRGGNDKIHRMWGAAASYQLPDTKVFLGYMGGSDRSGWLDPELKHSTRAAPTGGNFIDNPRKDMTLYTGFIYTGAAPWTVSTAFYYNDADDIYGVKDNDGKRYTAIVVAEYSLSKRTQVYGTVDFNKVTNGAKTALPGKSNQTGLAFGLRHMF